MLMTVLARYAGESTEGGTVWYEKGMNWAKNKAYPMALPEPEYHP